VCERGLHGRHQFHPHEALSLRNTVPQADAPQARFLSEVRLMPQGPIPVKCYCGFECATEGELKEHIIKTHGARDGDWKGWVSH